MEGVHSLMDRQGHLLWLVGLEEVAGAAPLQANQKKRSSLPGGQAMMLRGKQKEDDQDHSPVGSGSSSGIRGEGGAGTTCLSGMRGTRCLSPVGGISPDISVEGRAGTTMDRSKSAAATNAESAAFTEAIACLAAAITTQVSAAP